MATKVTAIWRYGAPDVDFDATWAAVRAHAAGGLRRPRQRRASRPRSGSWRKAMLERHEELDEVRMVLPNLHHWTVDLTRFGIDNDRLVYVATTRAARPDRGDGAPLGGGMRRRRRRRSRGPPVPGSDRVLTDDALAFLADLQRRFGPVRDRPPPAPPRAPGRARRRRRARLPAGHRRHPRRRLDRRSGAAPTSTTGGSRSPARPSRR